MTTPNASAAPSAVPGTVPPASVPAPATPAPSAVAPNPLLTPADFAAYATAALDANQTPPQPQSGGEPPPTAAPATPAAIESPAAPSTPAVETGTPSGEPEDDAEPGAEVLESLSETGRRALQSEREKRKEARARVKELEAQLADLTTRLNPTPEAPAPSATAPNPETPATAAAVPIPTTPSVTGVLADCRTFEQVDASAMAALQQKSLATELILNMAAGDRDAVIQRLEAEKVDRIGGVPLAEASDAQIRKLLVNVQAGCELTLQQAPARKAQLHREAQSFGEAVNILPGLKDPKTEAFKAFQQFVQQNPGVRQLGPTWPEMVADGIANRLARNKNNGKPNNPNAAGPVTAPAPATPKSAPGAPKTSVAGLPKKSELDEVRERIANGSGSAKDMQRYAELSLG